jgi:hypothetical protein
LGAAFFALTGAWLFGGSGGKLHGGAQYFVLFLQQLHVPTINHSVRPTNWYTITAITRLQGY